MLHVIDTSPVTSVEIGVPPPLHGGNPIPLFSYTHAIGVRLRQSGNDTTNNPPVMVVRPLIYLIWHTYLDTQRTTSVDPN
jgi:hypothetical protein